MTPESRKDQLLAQAVGQELVIYDQRTHTAHRLNQTAALVWRLADGERSIDDIAKILHDTAGTPNDEDVVRVALGELQAGGLLVRGLSKIDEPISRRRVLMMTAALIPVVTSIAVPADAAVCSANSACTVSPSSGSVTGGTEVSLTVAATHNFNFKNATGVRIDGKDATSFLKESDTKLTFTTPANSVGAKNIAITGIQHDTVTFTYVASLSTISPATGSAAGGTPVTISGVGFTGANSVRIGGVAATSVVVVSDTQITAVTPAGSVGVKNVVVGYPSTITTLVATLTGGFRHDPVLSSISPATGPAVGGTAITITGSGLTGANSVTIGGVAATDINVVSNTQITAVTPAGSAGAKDVVVGYPSTITTLVATLTGGFTYEPALSGISPTTGPAAGGTAITITGSGLTGANSVTIGGVAATGINVVSNTQITAITPVGLAGAKDVVVGYPPTITTLVATLTGGFTYAGSSTTSQTFNYTGSVQAFVVPAGVTSLHVDASGAQGAVPLVGNPTDYGKGGRIETTIAVTPGESLDIIVGGQGQTIGPPAFPGGGTSAFGSGLGGGGGGYSGVCRGIVYVAIAGGGGGGGYGGGNLGGAGGGTTGGAGTTNSSSGGGGGGGGTQSAGGAGGSTVDGLAGTFGLQGQGGHGAASPPPATQADGGGGGAGYFGGGGGGSAGVGKTGGGGGGGGSSFSSGTSTTHHQGVRDGDGVVILTY